MSYNHGREERKWRIWKEAEKKILRKHGVDESTIDEIRTYDRAEFVYPIDIYYNAVGIINAPSTEEYEEMFQERLKQKRSKEGKTA